MSTRVLWVSTGVLAVLTLSSAPLRADDCRASAKLKDMKKASSDAAFGERKAAPEGKAAPERKVTSGGRFRPSDVYELAFDVQVSGCPEHGAGKFAKASYGTVTYAYKKRYVGAAFGESQEKGTVNWSERDKELSLSSKIEAGDSKGAFEVSDVQIERAVCGCR